MASPAPSGGGGKFLGLKPRTALIVLGVAVVGGVVFFWWRSRQSKTAASSVSASAAASGIDYSGELSTIQAELEQLLSQEGQPVTAPSGGGGTGGTPGVGNPMGCPGGFHWDAAQQRCVPGAGEGGPPPGGTDHGGSGGKPKPSMPANVRVTRVTSSSVTLHWTKAANATSYRIRVTYQNKLVHSQSVSGNSATVGGLQPDHTYTFHVASCRSRGHERGDERAGAEDEPRMITMRRTLYGYGIHNHPPVHVTPAFPGRPCNSYSAAFRMGGANMSGPAYAGMDPSDPSTWVRTWNPAPGMISFLNFDGAAMSGRTPTQLQRGPQARPRRLRIGP